MTKRETLPKKIAVLMGGPGSEREVSLATGRGVAKALRSLGAEVVEIDVRDENFQLPNDVDLAFNTIHGTFGEDGHLQKILEGRGIAYTGEGVVASEIAFDKIRTKEKFQEHGVTTPPSEVIHAGQRPTIPLPIVVKAPRQGSTVGVVIVKNESELESAIAEASKYGRELLIEKFVAGRELTIGILGDQALPILEIIPKGGVLRFQQQVSISQSAGRRRSGARLSGKHRRGKNKRNSGTGAPRISLSRPAGVCACGRNSIRRRTAVHFGDQHHSRHDRG